MNVFVLVWMVGFVILAMSINSSQAHQDYYENGILKFQTSSVNTARRDVSSHEEINHDIMIEVPESGSYTMEDGLSQKHQHQLKHFSRDGIHNDHNGDNEITPRFVNFGKPKKRRLMKILRNYKLDFTKFDTTCMKREGRGLMAPSLPNSRVVKYVRRKNKTPSRNPYAMALYKCNAGYEFSRDSSDRMFCSKNKWIGPTPTCLPITPTLDESECQKCDQICTGEEDMNGRPRATCSCYAGYKMLSNGTCGDINECLIDNGGCSEICYNKPGSFQCFCPSGFRVGPDGKTCIDRNECLLRNGHGPCQDTCENTPGSYLCSCKNINGTRLSSDDHSCEDINECEGINNFGCSHICINTFGNAFCTCPKGLTLSLENYKICLGEIENLVEELTTTTPAPIICPAGSSPAFSTEFGNSSSQICVEDEDCTKENGGCEHECIPSGSYRFCACRNGYELVNETACVDINECDLKNGNCEQICVNLPGSFYCECENGFKMGGDKKTCHLTVCEQPPIKDNTVGWDCEYSSSSLNGNRPSVGTRCKLRCIPGFSLMSPHDSFLNSIFVGSFVEDDNSILSAVAHKWITCGEDGIWKGLEAASKSICVLTSCSRLTEPEHGTIFPREICLDDNVPLNSQCLLLCDSGYYPRNGRIRTCSRGIHWFPDDSPVCIKLPHVPRPYIHCPSDVQVDLPAGQGTAYVKIPQPQANMDWQRYVEAIPAWAKNLEWEGQAGITEISFVARSPISNETASCHFKVHVVDREAPRVHGCPTSFEIRMFPEEGSREVWWSEPKFSDNVNVKFIQQSHSPGHALSRGNHHISYVAGDAEGNKARCSFTVTVHGRKEELQTTDYSYYPGLVGRPDYSSSSFRNFMIICPNLKTGRWIVVHYAFHLPRGCRYSPPNHYESNSNYFNKNTKKDFSNSNAISRHKTLHHYFK